MSLVATSTLQPVRTLVGAAGVFPNDPPVSTPELAALPTWIVDGRSQRVAVWLAAVDVSGARVVGVRATVGGYFFTSSLLFGLDKPDFWHDAHTQVDVSLDEPFVFCPPYTLKMGVRVSSVVDGTNSAVEIRMSVQVMP